MILLCQNSFLSMSPQAYEPDYFTYFSNRSSLLMMLCRGLYMSDADINRIVPVLSTFCSMFSHSLHTLHDADFYGDNPGMTL